MRAILLAGGKGVRLRPYTTTLPKPLVPIGDEMPILEVVIRQLRGHGFTHITIAVNHLANLIMAFFGDGTQWGVKIDYSLENKPLSTIGPLTLIPDLPENFLIMNGDLLTDLPFDEFLKNHIRSGGKITVASYVREQKIDFGVLDSDDSGKIIGFREKPAYTFNVSMGVYALHRSVIEALPQGEPYGFDNLMIDGIAQNKDMRVYPFTGYWLDIGRPDDYERANEEFPELKKRLFKV